MECGIDFSGKSILAAYATYDLGHKKVGEVRFAGRYEQEEDMNSLLQIMCFTGLYESDIQQLS